MAPIIMPIAFVKNTRQSLVDDYWGDIISEIELEETIPVESLQGLDSFSHIEVVFTFHLAAEPISFIRRPRGNPGWPMTGILAQRNKDRPNRLGITIAQLIKVEGRKLVVKHLDAVNGTPVLDIKPVMRQFLIEKSLVIQPSWVDEMLENYWM